MAKKYKKEHINLTKTLESLSGNPIPPFEIIEELNEFIDYLTNGEMKVVVSEQLPPTYNPNQLELFNEDKPEAADKNNQLLANFNKQTVVKTLPYGIIHVDEEILNKRFEFLEVKEYTAKVMLPMCQGYSRKQIEGIIHRSKGCVGTHFYELKERIGDFDNRTLRDIFLCNNEDYQLKYLAIIENNRKLYDSNYIKKTSI